jgi:hypothetical protein
MRKNRGRCHKAHKEKDTHELMRGRVGNPSPFAMGPNMGIQWWFKYEIQYITLKWHLFHQQDYLA